jgi:hypothetical protein
VIIEVSEHSHPGHTSRHTSWLFPAFDKLDTKPTFSDITLLFDNPGFVRASRNTIFAADAFVLIHQDHPIFSLAGGPGGAYLHTGRVITMLTLDG